MVVPSEQRERGTSPELRGDNGFIDTNPLPERCQFSFSDGRQCSMARSDIHPSLCRFHSEREDQLFGDRHPEVTSSERRSTFPNSIPPAATSPPPPA
jgi:hypothetical protein